MAVFVHTCTAVLYRVSKMYTIDNSGSFRSVSGTHMVHAHDGFAWCRMYSTERMNVVHSSAPSPVKQ